MKCRCGSALSRVEIEDEASASVVCASGHRIYFFRRDDGSWETQAARQKRLRRYRICEFCGEEYQMQDHKKYLEYRLTNRVCPACIRLRGFTKPRPDAAILRDPRHRRCDTCGDPYVPRTGNQNHCRLCAVTNRMVSKRESSREYNRKKRSAA